MTLNSQDIAVVSMAGIFPGALDSDQFFANILDQKSAVIRVPDGRWVSPASQMVSPGRRDRAASDRAGLIQNFTFDPQGFDLDPALLRSLDPVHHLVLAAGKQAAAQCALDPGTRTRTGVILAAIALPTEKASLLASNLLFSRGPVQISPFEALGATVVSSPAALLARALRCRGGSFTLDAACASSLFSIKLACEHLLARKADAMIAGGVSRPDALYTQVGFTQLAALSPTGRCAPFDRDADGLVVGEGVGILVLKRLEDALEAGDTIHGLIKGWGVSNDIQGNLVAPASEGQVRAMARAYGMAGWTVADIQYMECHGSGTPKGDQTELASIRQVAEDHGALDKKLAIGSVKSMVGHLLTAAGAAGFIKTLMAMKAATLPPSLNFTSLPDQSPALGTGIKVQTQPEPWHPAAATLPRRAAVSAFGFGGINAHLLVEEMPANREAHTGFSFSVRPDQACAIVGLALLGPLTLDPGQRPMKTALPEKRWRNPLYQPAQRVQTLFLDGLELGIKEFHIPPNQMADILPQHLFMLKAAKLALINAGIRPRPTGDDLPRLKMGAAIGIDFDFGAADFFLRWLHPELPEPVLDQISPPLTFDRTLGALGGIVASRIAREFKLGGPCFTLSAGPASGLKAIETAMASLSSGETDLFLCGAVDMAGDLCSHALNQALGAFKDPVPAVEGAVALVLKPLNKALADQDRIWAVIRGAGSAGAGPVAGESQPDQAQATQNLVQLSLSRALQGLLEGQDKNRTKELNHAAHLDLALGHWGAASGLVSVAQTAHGLSQTNDSGPNGHPGLAAVGSLCPDGACAHLLLEAGPKNLSSQRGTKGEPTFEQERPTIFVPAVRSAIPLSLLAQLNPGQPDPDPVRPEPSSPLPSPPLDSKALRPESGSPLGPEGPAFGEKTAQALADTHQIIARAHERFLDLSSQNLAEMGKQMAALARLSPDPGVGDPQPAKSVFLNRDQCLEFAVGKAGRVLGKAFEIIDTYPVRVRLPAEPLMLVDRILSVEGEMLSLGPGKVVTQHDVKEAAWYLDGGRAPVSIAIEAGQADLFLCAWLGIDHVVKGRRRYRLLDAKVTFHRPLPKPGETIEYQIQIDRFLRQGEIYLFFFHYQGYIDGLPLISMRDGCAGFFTEDEVRHSGGIILKKEDLAPALPKSGVAPLVPMGNEALSDERIAALRDGDLETAFGPAFKGVIPGKNQWLPGGRMTLIHRVLTIEPQGGRYGLGRVVAEADIHPDDWFLTCHFIDDMVMPGTLMYECCAHALRVFIQRFGWVSPSPDAYFDVLLANESDLKCRGPVTRKTKKARYEIEIKELGYGPEPYVKADAHMFSDGLRIVFYKEMGMKLAGVTGQELAEYWRDR